MYCDSHNLFYATLQKIHEVTEVMGVPENKIR